MAVPDTNTFSLLDVINEINPSSNDLATCFAEADPNKFDSNYYNDGNDLLEFRNYGASTYTLIADPNTMSFGVFGGQQTSNITIEPDAVPNISVIGTFISTSYDATNDILTVTVDRNDLGF